MTPSLIKMSTRKARGRIVLLLAVLAALALAWFGVTWQLGSMVAELTSSADPNAKYAASSARSLASRDPLAAWLSASVTANWFAPDKVDASINAYEDVVRLSPNDYRWWIELGRAQEQADRAGSAEISLRHAVDLAPAYVFPRWQLGNFLLRQGRSDEAFAELRRTTENNVTYREQVFGVAWDYFNHDPARVESIIADGPGVRASLALFYAARGAAVDSLRVWNTLTDEQKAENPQIAKTIAQALTEKKFYRQGLEFSRQVGIDPDAQIGQISNGGFERAIGGPDDNHYGWNVERSDNKLDISSDSIVRHSGNRSMRVTFRTYVKPELSDPWEVVAVEPGARYLLRFWVRTENLRSAGMPQIEVLQTADNRLISASQAFPTGTNDWQEMTMEIKAPDDSDGVIVRLARSYCGDACPMVGILWLDDFSITRR
jgi:hypothetical protein